VQAGGDVLVLEALLAEFTGLVAQVVLGVRATGPFLGRLALKQPGQQLVVRNAELSLDLDAGLAARRRAVAWVRRW